MTDLASWLLTQIADDEAAARAANAEEVHWLAEYGASATSDFSEAHIKRHDPARVLAECAAKRARVEYLAEAAAKCPPDDWPDEGGMDLAALADQARYLLLLEAQPFADRPGFDPAWKVET